MTLPDTEPKQESNEEEFVVKSTTELIEHLSSEIDAFTRMMFDWRARAAFYWLVGPFVVISSVVIVTKQLPTVQRLDVYGWIALVIAGACFMGMGYIGARIEAHMTNQCNVWRLTILRLSSQDSKGLRTSNVLEEKQRVIRAYLSAHGLLLIIFICCTVIFLRSASSAVPATTQSAPAPSSSPTSVKP